MDLVLLLSLLQLEAGVEAGEGALSSPLSFAPFPYKVLSMQLLVESWSRWNYHPRSSNI